MAASLGAALRAYFSSKSAEGKGSPNFSGVANPVVDALIDNAVAANDRQSLYFACRALDAPETWWYDTDKAAKLGG